MRSLYISYNAITEPIVQSQVIPYLKGLSRKGIRFCLLTFEKKKLEKKARLKIKETLKKEFGNDSAFVWYSLRYHKWPSAPATLFDAVAGWLLCVYIILRHRIDIIHARAIVPALMGFAAAKMLSKKFIFDTRGIDSEEYVDAGQWKRGGLKHSLTAFLEGVIIRFSDHVVVLTEKFRDILKSNKRYKNVNFSVIPCAVDTDRFRPGKDRNAFLTKTPRARDGLVIAYVGSLGTWYMLEEMLDFFKAALESNQNAHFMILTQTDRSYALGSIRNKGLEAGHFTLDTVAHDSVPDYLSGCDAGIFFIKPVFSKLSSSPVKFGEYLSCGLPVIINHGIGDTEELVRANRIGVSLDNFDKASYHKALDEINQLLKDKDLAARCRLTAERHLSLKSAVETYGEIYEKAVGREGWGK